MATPTPPRQSSCPLRALLPPIVPVLRAGLWLVSQALRYAALWLLGLALRLSPKPRPVAQEPADSCLLCRQALGNAPALPPVRGEAQAGRGE